MIWEWYHPALICQTPWVLLNDFFGQALAANQFQWSYCGDRVAAMNCSRWHHTLSTGPTIKAEGLLGEPSSGNSALRHACLCNQQLLTESWDYTIYIINPRTRPLRTIGSFCSMDRYLSMSILDFKVTLCLLYVRESRPILWQIAIDWSFSRHSLVSSGSNAGDMVDCCRTRI